MKYVSNVDFEEVRPQVYPELPPRSFDFSSKSPGLSNYKTRGRPGMATRTQSKGISKPSPVSAGISESNVASAPDALCLEVFHNLQHQHHWDELNIHPSRTSALSRHESAVLSPPLLSPVPLISGVPPHHVYTHPDFQAHLLKHDIKITDVPVQREFVVPMSIGEIWSLRRLCEIFDALPEREIQSGYSNAQYKHKDAKRVLLGMLAHNGLGGDGTIVYYVMQEGEVKPRQN